MEQPVNRILICKLKFYGDVLLITPVIASLKARYPQARIDVLLYKDTKEILAADDRIQQFYLVEKKRGWVDTLKNYLSLQRVLKKNGYDLILNLSEQWPIAALIASLRRPSIAFQREKRLWNMLFSHVVPAQGTHIVEQNLSLLRGIGFSDSALRPQMQLHYRESDIQALLTQDPELKSQPYVVIQPTARQPFKCWDDDKFAQIVNHLHTLGLKVYLTCGPAASEQQQVKRIADQCDAPPDIRFAGKTSFLQLAALLDHATLYIGVDSAPMHMAAALGKPQICLFGATNYRQWRPWSDSATLIWAGDYHPMPERKDLDRSQKYLSWIPAQAVIVAIDTRIETNVKQADGVK